MQPHQLTRLFPACFTFYLTDKFLSVIITLSDIYLSVNILFRCFFICCFLTLYDILVQKEGEKVTIGKNIKRIRKEKGMTQKQLGELCGINEANVRKYELGKANPKIETVNKIASALGVTAFDIMGVDYFDSITDLKSLRNEITKAGQFEELFISIYGQAEYDSFMQYSVLTEEGSKKVKEYINDLFTNPLYRVDK